MAFILFISFLILQRLSELVISSRNAKWLLNQGAVEYGTGHYPFIVAMHTMFIVSIIAEYYIRDSPELSYPFLALFFLLLVFKYWVISSLGKYWNTRIYRVPGFTGVVKGPYKFMRHPNYAEVIGEILVIPLVFHLYYTAIIFTVLNACMLAVRITEENKVWKLAPGSVEGIGSSHEMV